MAHHFAKTGCLALALTLGVACSNSGVDDAYATGGAGGTGASGGTNAAGGEANANATGGEANATGGEANANATGGEANATGGDANSSGGEAGIDGAPALTPYANVTGVVTSGNDGAYTFNVTVESSDVDCTEFADWWEVLSGDGALVYRRILEHSHTDANGTSDADAPGNTFTRSGGTVSVAADDVVIVRAHMSVGGYNGRVMRGSASAGFADAPDIGSDFAADVEREDPQPTGCEF